MKKRCTLEQIEAVLEAAKHASVVNVCRHFQINRTTFYRWMNRRVKPQSPEQKHIAMLETENARLRRALVEQTLEIQELKEGLEDALSRAQV